MSQTAPEAKQTTMVQEFAAELTMTPEELAATLDPLRSGATAGAATAPAAAPGNMDMIMRIPVSVRVILGSATMPVASLAKLGRGAVIPLDRRVGEPVDVVVNGRVIARGEVVVIEDGNSRFGLKLTEVVAPSVDKAS
jgi:flagellar motor switch protein FliN/FliY